MTQGSAKVFQYRRSDPVSYLLQDFSTEGVRYWAETESFSAEKSQSVWQIRRETYQSDGTLTTIYANHGKYNSVWDNRAVYFPALPLDLAPFPDTQISASIGQIDPIALSGPGLITVTDLVDFEWRPIIPLPQVGRKALNILNISGVGIVYNYTSNPAVTTGYPLDPDVERNLDAEPTLILYARSTSGAAQILVEEIANTL